MLHKEAGYMESLVKEATEIQLNTRNLNSDDDFNLRQAWYPATTMLYNQKTGSVIANT
jgi:hypothetical protein